MFKQSDLDPKYDYVNMRDPMDIPERVEYSDKDSLVRNDAFEMVAFINHILKTWKWNKPFPQAKRLETGKKIERLVQEHIPEKLHLKETHIEPWLRSNWNNF